MSSLFREKAERLLTEREVAVGEKPQAGNKFRAIAETLLPEEKKPTFLESTKEAVTENLLAVPETVGTLASGVVQFLNPIPGLVGIYKGVRAGSVEEATRGVEETQRAFAPYLSFQPTTQRGRESVELIQKTLDFLITKPSEWLGEKTLETGERAGLSTTASAGLATVAKIAAELVGYHALFGSMHGVKQKLTSGELLKPPELKAFEEHVVKVSRAMQKAQEAALKKTRVEAAEIVKESPFYRSMSSEQQAEATEYLARSLAGLDNPKPKVLPAGKLVEGAKYSTPAPETIVQQAAKKPNIFRDFAVRLGERFVKLPETRLAVRELIKKRSVDIDWELLKGEKFVHDVTRDLTPIERHAVTFLREGVTDYETIRSYGGQALVDAIRKPSDRTKTAVAEIGKYFDESYKLLERFYDSPSYIENYVTHIWDIPKNKKGSVMTYFSTKSPFLKKRTVMSFEEGMKLGLKPRTTDIVDLVRTYHNYLVKSTQNLKFAESLKAIPADDGLPLLRAAGDAPVDWVEVKQPFFDKVVFAGKVQRVVSVKTFVREVRETVDRLKTIYEAGDWKQAETSKQIGALERIVSEALESRGMTKGEASVYLNKLKQAYSGKELSSKPKEALESVKTTISETLREMKKREVVDMPVFQRHATKVPAEIASDLETIFGSTFRHPIAGAVETVNAFLKKSWLSLTLFHHAALSESATGTGISTKMVKLWNPKKVYDAVQKGDFAIFEQMPLAEDAIKKGLVKFGALEDVKATHVRRALISLENATRGTKLVGKAAEGLRKGNDLWDKGLWDYYHNTLKLYSYEAHKIAAIKSARKKLGRELTEPELDAIKKEVGEFTNDSFGGQNWDIAFILGKPKVRQVMHWMLLSPDWLISTIRQATAPAAGVYRQIRYSALAKKAAEAGKGPEAAKFAAEQVGAKMLTRQGALFWLRSTAYFFLITNAVNYYNTQKFHGEGRFTWQNPTGHELDVLIGYNEDGTERYLRLGKQFRELPEWIMRPEEKLGSKLGPMAKETLKQFTKHDPGSGFPSEFADEKFWESLPKRAKSIAQLPIPFVLRPYVNEQPGQFMLAFPSNKGLTRWKTRELFKEAIEEKNLEQVKKIFIWGLENGHDSLKLLNEAAAVTKRRVTIDNKTIARDIFKEMRTLDPTAKMVLLRAYAQRGVLNAEVAKELEKLVGELAEVQRLKKGLGVRGREENEER